MYHKRLVRTTASISAFLAISTPSFAYEWETEFTINDRDNQSAIYNFALMYSFNPISVEVEAPHEEFEFLSRESNLKLELKSRNDDRFQVFETSDYIGYDFEQFQKDSDQSLKLEYTIETKDSPNSWTIGVVHRETKADAFSASYGNFSGDPENYDTYIKTDDGAFGISVYETDIESERVFASYSRYLTNDWTAGLSVAVGEFGHFDETRVAVYTKKLWHLSASQWIGLEGDIERIDRDFATDWVGSLEATYYPDAKTGVSLSFEEGDLVGSQHYGIGVRRFFSDNWNISLKTIKTRIDNDFGEPDWEQTSTKLSLGLRF